ncbi:MAG TPA: MgtC/SapB family protein [Chitinophagales bacterium]|nr:MgtC/SapB family protein [Chitinophagales bacterium]
MELTMQDILKIFVSLAVGGIIGMEREYRTKPAGFRTLILICVGSTLFTMLSLKIGGVNNGDRIASYILVGVGFIGSGVIFKEGLKITGLTTASTIWITAALGMAIGDGYFLLAAMVMLIVFVVLEIFSRLENILDHLNASKIFLISFKADEQIMMRIEENMKHICPKIHRSSMKRKEDVLTCVYRIEGGRKRFKDLQQYLLRNQDVIGFES